MLIAQIVAANDLLPAETICTPNGWTLIRQQGRSDGSKDLIRVNTYYRVATAAAGATSYTWQAKTTAASCGIGAGMRTTGLSAGIIRYSGVDTTGPIFGHAGSSGTSSGPFTAPDVASAPAGSQVLRFFGAQKKQVTITQHASSPTSAALIYNPNTQALTETPRERTMAAFEATQAATGNTNLYRVNFSSSAEWASQTVVLRMAATNAAPAINRNNATVTVNEGQTAANTGTWSDANAGDSVTLSTSVGAVVKSGTNASGTWSWSFGTTDGPAQSQTVTITANDGTVSSQTTFDLVVTNLPPTGTLGNNGPVSEGSAATVSFTGVSDPSSVDAASLHYAFDCAGGSLAAVTYAAAGTSSSTPCTFNDNGSFNVTGVIIDKDGGRHSASTSVTVDNAPPTGTLGNNGPVSEGSAATVSFTGVSDPSSVDAASLHYAFDCAGGSLAAVTYAAAGTSSSTPCTFNDNGSFNVTGVIIDKDGGRHSASTSVTVDNVAPTATFTAPDTAVDEGDSFNISLDDPQDVAADVLGGFEYKFDCGSGYGVYGPSSSTSCPTTDNGTLTVKGTIKDKDGGETEYTDTVTVANVDPSATFNAPSAVNEGSSINISLTGVVDPGTADTHQFRFSCDGGTTFTAYGAASTHSCATTDDGTKTVQGQVRDDDGGTSPIYSENVTVENVDPSATFNAPNDVNEGSSINISLTGVVDPGTADTHQFRFSCDGGTTFTAYGAASTHSCATTDDGTKTVQGQVRDDDGGTSPIYSENVTVENVDPSATFNAPNDVNEGSSINISLTGVVDPGTADTHQFRFSCDGGTTFTAYGAASTHSCATTDDGTKTVQGQVRDDDGGTSPIYSATVTVNNVAPTVVKPSFAATLIGCQTTVTLTGISFSDPGADSPWTVTIDWGDGSTDTTFAANSPGSQPNQMHTYASAATFTATVYVNDGDVTSSETSSNTTTVYQHSVQFRPPVDGSNATTVVDNKMKNGRVVPVKVTIGDLCSGSELTDPSARENPDHEGVGHVRPGRPGGGVRGRRQLERRDERVPLERRALDLQPRQQGARARRREPIPRRRLGGPVRATVATWAILAPVK